MLIVEYDSLKDKPAVLQMNFVSLVDQAAP